MTPTSMPRFSELSELLQKHFPDQISAVQMDQFQAAFEAYVVWNERINVISRKDILNLAERHFLHSLSIAKSIRFAEGTKVLDAGTGGGFPGVPLAILFPETSFHLVDSIAKKIRVVEEVVLACGIKNVQSSVQRFEQLTGQYDFVVSRAVTSLDQFVPMLRKRIHCRSKNSLPNGVLYLRGGEISEEIAQIRPEPPRYQSMPLSDWFDEPFFESKYLVHLTFCPPIPQK